MHPLDQRLKELDPDTFQKLCFHLLKGKYPGANIRSVDGSAGDEGIDMFLGDLTGGLTIWQCKSFPNGVRDSQKRQIRKSLRRAKKLKPKRWILCLSIDMRAGGHRWFQKVQKDNAPIEIDLLQGSDIVGELIYSRPLRNHFFRDVGLDLVELKRILMKSDELSAEELESLTEANMEDFVERLKERDPRFKYEVVFNEELGPETVPTEPRPGQIFSIKDPTKTINVFARDVKALEEDPPKLELKLQGAGIDKFISLMRTGAQQEFSPDEIVSVATNLKFPGLEQSPAKLFAGPPPEVKNTRIPARITFFNDSEKIEYDYIVFKPLRVGTEESELVTADTKIPFELKLVIPRHLPSQGPLSYKERFAGHEIREIKKFVHAINILCNGGELKIWDLERGADLVQVKIEFDQSQSLSVRESEEFIDDLIRISNRFGAKLIMPDEISMQDIETFTLLKAGIDGGTLPIDKSLHAVLIKSEENQEVFRRLLATEGAFRFAHQKMNPNPTLFGTEINTGPCALSLDRARFENPEETLRRFDEAAVGAGIPIALQPLSPVRFILLDKPLE